MKGAIVLTSAAAAAAAALTLMAAPVRAAQAEQPCPDNLNAPCDRPVPPCTPVERPCQG